MRDKCIIFSIEEIDYMAAIAGTYKNGSIKLDKDFAAEGPVKVIVIFLEEPKIPSPKRLLLSDFSFAESQAVLGNFKGSLSDVVIDERWEWA